MCRPTVSTVIKSVIPSDVISDKTEQPTANRKVDRATLSLLIFCRRYVGSPPPVQSWGVLVGQTESLSRVMRERSEDLQDGPMSKLTLLIKDKQQLRKSYGEQWNLLSQEHSKVTHTHTRTL